MTAGKVALSGSGSTALGSEGIPHDVEVGIVDGVVLVRSGRDAAEGLRIEKFPAAEGGVEHVAASAGTRPRIGCRCPIAALHPVERLLVCRASFELGLCKFIGGPPPE